MNTILFIVGIILFFVGVTIFIYAVMGNNYNYSYKDINIITTDYDDNYKTEAKHFIVWTYWEGSESKLVNLCLNNITKSCMYGSYKQYTFEHIHLNKCNINDYVNIDNHVCSESKSHLKSDIIRLSLLLKYGGIWLDASVFILQPMNYVFFKDGNHPIHQEYFFGIYNSLNNTNDKYPVIETSAICCNAGNKLVKMWLDEISNIIDCSEQSREQYAKKHQLIYLKNLIPQYHYVYYCLQKVLNENNGIDNFDGIHLVDSVSSNYFCYKSFDIKDFIDKTTINFIKKYDMFFKSPIIKFIKNERNYIDKMWDKIISSSILNFVDFKNNGLPVYYLHDRNNKNILNTSFELTEQNILLKTLIHGDRVLQVGGNIGTSCITANKIANLEINHCVEPQQHLLPILKYNIKQNNVNTTIIDGILTESTSDKKMSTNDGDVGTFVSSGPVDNPSEKIKTYSLYDIKPDNGYTYLFADCEGCFPEFIKEYGDELSNHPIHTIVYEEDQGNREKKEYVDYTPVNNFMKQNNYKCTGDFHKTCKKNKLLCRH